MDSQVAHAMNRFGLGRRGAEAAPADPRGWLASQLDGADRAQIAPIETANAAFTAIMHNDAAYNAFAHDRSTIQPRFIGTLFESNRQAAMLRAVRTAEPFRERLVMFWANHFTVSARAGGPVLAMLGPYINEAIRPHVTGKFSEMLNAVIRHPAMIWYLNNDGSIGPNSRVGLAQHRGLNENLARECLELHTVGVDAGYTQQDVTRFAAILTGWGVQMNPAGFVFRPNWHEPGIKVVMDHAFPEGEAGGVEALEFLGRHPATYRHIARQLVTHFVADDPTEDEIAAIADVLWNSDGDLKAASLALLDLPRAWTPLTKFRAPIDYAVAVFRALDPDWLEGPPAVFATNYLGQPLWAAPLPNGWSDLAADWVGGEELVRRADWAWDLAGRRDAPDPQLVAERTLGGLVGPATTKQVSTAPSRREALALLLASPEFMRR